MRPPGGSVVGWKDQGEGFMDPSRRSVTEEALVNVLVAAEAAEGR
jgi:hypothetical protein